MPLLGSKQLYDSELKTVKSSLFKKRQNIVIVPNQKVKKSRIT